MVETGPKVEIIMPEVIEPEAEEIPESAVIKELFEGDLVEFPNLAKVDEDGDQITYAFSSPLDDKGKWQTKQGDAGEYTATITASDGTNEPASKKITVVVNDVNRPPVFDQSAFG